MTQLRQRVMTVNKEDLTGSYIRFFQKRGYLLRKVAAARSLEVGELHQLHRRLRIAAVEVAVGIHSHGQIGLLGRRL